MFDLGINIALGEISQLQSDLNRTTGAVNAAMSQVQGSVARAQSSFQSLRNEIPLIDKAFRLLANPISLVVGSLVALGVGFGDAVKTAQTFEKQLADTAAIVTAGFDTATAQKQLAELSDEAVRLGSTTEFTATQAAEAFGFLGRAGFNTAQILDAGADTLALASVGNLELARAAEISTNVLSQFQKEASELGSVVDVLAKAVNSSNTDVNQFAEAMKFIGPTAQALGVSLEETSAVIGILANNGLTGSVATRALGTSLTRLAAPTKQIQEAIDRLPLGLEAFNQQTGEFVGLASLVGQLERNFEGLTDQQQQAALSTIFGAEALQEFNILVSNGQANLEEYTAQIEAAGAQNGAFAESIRRAKLDTLSGALDSLSSAFEGLQIVVAGGTLPILKDFVFAGADILLVITELVKGTKNFSDVFGPVGAALDRFFQSVQTVGQSLGSVFSEVFGGANGEITQFAALIGSVLEATLVNLIDVFARVNVALSATIQFFADMIGYVKDNADVIALVVIGLGAFNLKMVIAAAETLIFKGAMEGAGIALNLYNKAQTAFNVAQTAFTRGLALARGAVVAMNAALIANPIGIVVGAIALLAAGIVVLYRESQTFRAIVSGVWNVLVQGVEFFRNLYNEAGIFGKVLLAMSGPLGLIIVGFQNFESIAAGVSSAFRALGTGISAFTQAMVQNNPVLRLFTGYLSLVRSNLVQSIEVFTDFGRAVISVFSDVREQIQSLLGIDIATIFKTILLGPLASLETEFRAVGQKVANAFNQGYKAQIASEQQKVVAEQAKRSAAIIADAAAAGLNQSARSSQLVAAGAAAAGNFINAVNQQIRTLDATDAGRALAENLTRSVNDALKAGTLTQVQADELLQSISTKLQGQIIEAPTLAPQVDIQPAQGSITELQNRLSELEKQIQATGTAQNLFAGFSEQTEAVRERVAELKAELADISANVDVSFAGDLNRQLAEIDITGQAQQIGQTLTAAINQALASGQISSEQAEKLLANLEQKVSALSIQGPDVSVDLDTETAQNNLNDLQALISDFENQVGKPGKDAELLAGMIGQANQAQTELRALQTQFDILRAGATGSLAALQAQLAAVNDQLNRTATDSPLFAGLVAQSVSLQTEIDRIQEKLDLLKQGIDLDFGEIPALEIPAKLQLDLDNVLLQDVPNLDLGTLTITPPDIEPFSEFALAMKSIGGEVVNVTDQSEQLRLASEALGLSQDLTNRYFRDYRDLLKVVSSGSFQLAETFGATKDQALDFSIEMQRLEESIQSAMIDGGVDAVQAFGTEFGKALAEGSAAAADFGSVFEGVIKAFLVDITKLIGVALIKASIPLLPESLPVLLAGVALVGLSGLVNGLTGSLGQGGRNTDLGLPDGPGAGVSAPLAQGLAAQSAGGETGITNNVTILLESDGIITEIERRRIVGQQLRDGK